MRSRLATDLALGLVLNGLPFAFVAAFPSVPVALAALAVVGIGNSVVDVSAITLLQRAVPDEVLGRVLGAIESVLLASLGIGALLAPLLISARRPPRRTARRRCPAAGARRAVVGGLRRIDAGAEAAPRRVELLAAHPDLRAAAAADARAARLPARARRRLPAGTLILRQGDPGDRFYVIAEGEVEIEGRATARAAFFGEIALLKDVPRNGDGARPPRTSGCSRSTATSSSRPSPGHEPSAAAADAVVSARLGSLRPEVASV